MSKRSKRRGRQTAAAAAPAAPPRRVRRFRLAAALLAACTLLAASFAATRYEPLRRAVGLGPLPAPVAQSAGSLPLAKEYVYAGGRLVATEEPTPTPAPTPAGPPPTNLLATATSEASVSLTWAAPAAGVAIGYVVERRGGLGDQPVEIATQSDTTTFNDSPPTGDHAYLYRVRAVFGGGYSDYGNYDLATTVPFTDESLQGVVIQAAHLTELRRAVRAVRVLAGKGEPAWSHPDPVSLPAAQRRVIFLADVTDLRQQLDEALTQLDQALGVQTFLKPYPAQPVLVQYAPVYAAHFEQIRVRVR
jgi:hypothetical protein